MEEEKPFRIDYTVPENSGDQILTIFIRAANLTFAKHNADKLPYSKWKIQSIKKDTEENYEKWLKNDRK